MDIVYDAEKSAANTVKHSISLAEATRFEWDDALIWNDERKNYGEVRHCAIGYIDLRLYCIVYVLRDDVRRIISLRKANSREVNNMPRLKPGTVIPTPEEDAIITAAAMDDPDALPFTDEEWANVKPVRGRGRPLQAVTKAPISIRLDVRVLDAFKATGEGWQTRMNDALTEWADQHGMLERTSN